MKIYFIEAERDKTQSPTSNWVDPLTRKFSCPSLAPLVIASQTPKDIEIRITDIQTSRGCSLNCEFCPTREMFGGIFRTKSVKQVIQEIQAAISIEQKIVFFTDTFAGRELDKQGRILSKDWALYDNEHVVFEPEKMNAKDLEEGFNWIKGEISSLSQIRLDEDRPVWKIITSRCLAEILAILPIKNRRSSERPQ